MDPFTTLGQGVHAPHASDERAMSRHRVPQVVSGTGQVAAQPPGVHTEAHFTPQAPQFFPSVRSVSQPSAGSPLQSPYPGSQAPRAQRPWPSQVPAAWAKVHG
jgi:hypothetical protein